MPLPKCLHDFNNAFEPPILLVRDALPIIGLTTLIRDALLTDLDYLFLLSDRNR